MSACMHACICERVYVYVHIRQSGGRTEPVSLRRNHTLAPMADSKKRDPLKSMIYPLIRGVAVSSSSTPPWFHPNVQCYCTVNGTAA